LVSNSNFRLIKSIYYLIDIIPREPPWGESETCLECGVKFTITNRKHHWLVFEFNFCFYLINFIILVDIVVEFYVNDVRQMKYQL